MLVDGGTGEPDTGRNAVAPYLWSQGIRGIDYLVSTHSHPDHYGGLIYIMNNFRIGEIWLNGRTTDEPREFVSKMEEKKIPGRVLRRGDVFQTDRFRIYALHPYDEFISDSSRGGFSNENSASLVLKIESGGASILLTGDIENEAEDSLLPLGKWLASDIIKVPHHGGRTSSSPAFLKAVNPQIAVVSVGNNNIYHHPHKEVIERYERAGVKLYRTDLDGAVTIRCAGTDIKRDRGGFSESSYHIQTYRDSVFKEVKTFGDEVRNLKLLLVSG